MADHDDVADWKSSVESYQYKYIIWNNKVNTW
jgi:hypothetical protein